MLETGIKGRLTAVVTTDNTARAMGSGTLDVFATPAMIALMERTAAESVQGLLPEGDCTVGTEISVRHTAASPVGAEIICDSFLVTVDGRRLVFEVIARDSAGEIGRGRHERFIVHSDRFTEKAAQRIASGK